MENNSPTVAQRKEMLQVNLQQSKFYELPDTYHSAGGSLAKIWRNIRNSQNEVSNRIGVNQDIYRLHREWMGELTGQKVLDLGCYDGNPLSFEIAQKAQSYLGIDLSEFAIGKLREELQQRGFTKARALAVDFLSPEFSETNFDLVYAHSVAHHFKYFEAFLQTLSERLAPGGKVVTLDPMQTYLPAKIARLIYRPFQPDKDWEWPFSKQTFVQIQKYFEIEKIQGTTGNLKWAMPLAFFNKELAIRAGQRWHQNDLQKNTGLNQDLWRCLHVTMCWRKR